jgi:hypothetical protein
MLLSSGKKPGSGQGNVAATMLFGKPTCPWDSPIHGVFKKLTAGETKSAKMPLSQGNL